MSTFIVKLFVLELHATYLLCSLFILGGKCSVYPPLDISIVIDQTKSVGKETFLKMKAFVESLVDKYDVSEDHTHVSIMTYAGDPTIHNTLADRKYHSKASLKKLIENIPNKLGSPTRTDKALEAARDKVFTAENGDRPDAPNVMIILKDVTSVRLIESPWGSFPNLQFILQVTYACIRLSSLKLQTFALVDLN